LAFDFVSCSVDSLLLGDSSSVPEDIMVDLSTINHIDTPSLCLSEQQEDIPKRDGHLDRERVTHSMPSSWGFTS
jgi:hypothetical protein